MAWPIVGGAMAEKVKWGKSRLSKPVSSVPERPLLQLLPWLPWMINYDGVTSAEMNPFLPKFLMVTVFMTATEAALRR